MMSAPTQRSVESRQLHLRLTADELPWLVREISRRALLGYLGREPSDDEIAAALPEVKKLLRQVITAYDLCGLTTICWEAAEYDPWEETEMDEVNP